ncbi:hypothetical protein GGI42DRAFT_335123 [Trichoderma sp. SZMC 28013]
MMMLQGLAWMARSAKRFVCVLMSLQYANNGSMRNTARQCFEVKQMLIVQSVLVQGSIC